MNTVMNALGRLFAFVLLTLGLFVIFETALDLPARPAFPSMAPVLLVPPDSVATPVASAKIPAFASRDDARAYVDNALLTVSNAALAITPGPDLTVRKVPDALIGQIERATTVNAVFDLHEGRHIQAVAQGYADALAHTQPWVTGSGLDVLMMVLAAVLAVMLIWMYSGVRRTGVLVIAATVWVWLQAQRQTLAARWQASLDAVSPKP